jgi:plastocyanin
MKTGITLLALLIFSSGYFVNESFAEISQNQAFLLEGSGFAVTEDFIKISEIDLGLSSQQQQGSTINFLTEDGFITLDDEEFTISNLNGKFLRGGQYIRINGNIESSNGFDTSISFFGRLVEKSKDASIYGFTGRITTTDDSFKVIYITKLSVLSKIDAILTPSKKSENLTIHILKDSSLQKTTTYFSTDKISIKPKTTITIVNDDIVSHNIISGHDTGNRNNRYISDGIISSGDILPGQSVTITFNDAGFYRLYDPNYNWMGIIAYVYPDTNTIVLGKGQNPSN